MIVNLRLKYIVSSYISVEENNREDDILGPLLTNSWIYKKGETFYIGKIEIVGKDTKLNTMIATNVNIVKPEGNKYIVVRNYYLFTYTYNLNSLSGIKIWQLDNAVEPLIIKSAQNGKLNRMLQMIYENRDVYTKDYEENE